MSEDDDKQSHRSSKSDAASIAQHLQEHQAKILANTAKNFGHLTQQAQDEIAKSAFENIKLQLVDTHTEKYDQFYKGLFANIDRQNIPEDEKAKKRAELEELMNKDR